MSLQEDLQRLKDDLEAVKAQGVDLNSRPDPQKAMFDFKTKRTQYLLDMVQNRITSIKNGSNDLLKRFGAIDATSQISVQVKFLEEYHKDPDKLVPIIDKIIQLTKELPRDITKPVLSYSLPSLHPRPSSPRP